MIETTMKEEKGEMKREVRREEEEREEEVEIPENDYDPNLPNYLFDLLRDSI